MHARGERKLNIDLLKKNGRVRVYNNDDIICNENDRGEYIYLLLSGKAFVMKRNTTKKERKQVATIQTGTVFGETSLFGDMRNASVVAKKDNTIVLEFEIESFKHLLKQEPKLAFMLLKTLIARIKTAMDKLITKDPAYVFECRCNDIYKMVNELDNEKFLGIVSNNFDYPITASRELNEMLNSLNNKLLS